MSKRTPQARGQCFLCGRIMTKGGLTRHLKKHLAERTGETDLVWIRVTDQTPWAVLPSSAFWLDLEVRADLPLEDLDEFLRAIWVECCGHLSHFVVHQGKRRISFERYMEDSWGVGSPSSTDPWKATDTDTGRWGPLWDDYPMAGRTVGEIADHGDAFEYEYDYGTTTMLRLRVMHRYQGPAPEEGIQVLSRNLKPFVRCAKCDREAAYWDVFNDYMPLCEEHAEEAEEGLLPIVNSPRTGLCGYDGPYDDSLTFEKLDLPREG